MTAGSRTQCERHRPQAAPQRGLARLRAAAVRDRRRDGRRAGRRGRVAARRRRPRGGGSGARAAEERIVELIQEANRRVFDRAHDDPTASGMGTTMTVALVEGDDVSIGHVGDSRAYLIRDGSIEQLTEDHSLVERAPEERQALAGGGGDPPAAVGDHARARHRPRRRRRHASPSRPRTATSSCSAPTGSPTWSPTRRSSSSSSSTAATSTRAAQALVKAANRGGGEDNITVVAFEIAPRATPDGEETNESRRSTADEDDARRGDARGASASGRRHDGRLGRGAPGRSPHADERAAAAAGAPDRATRANRRCSASCCSLSWPRWSSGGLDLCAEPVATASSALLIVVGVLTAIGFASVYIAPQSQVSTASLDVRGVLLRPLPRRAPVARVRGPVRRPVPAADRRAADRDRADGDLPAQPRRRVPAGALDRRRRRPSSR